MSKSKKHQTPEEAAETAAIAAAPAAPATPMTPATTPEQPAPEAAAPATPAAPAAAPPAVPAVPAATPAPAPVQRVTKTTIFCDLLKTCKVVTLADMTAAVLEKMPGTSKDGAEADFRYVAKFLTVLGVAVAPNKDSLQLTIKQ